MEDILIIGLFYAGISLALVVIAIWLLKTIEWVAKHVDASEEAREEYLERERLDREGRDL